MSLSSTPSRWWNKTARGESAGGIFKIYVVGGALPNGYHTRWGPVPRLPGPESGQEAGRMVFREARRVVAGCSNCGLLRNGPVAEVDSVVQQRRGVEVMPRYCVRSACKRPQCSTMPLFPSPKTKKRQVGTGHRGQSGGVRDVATGPPQFFPPDPNGAPTRAPCTWGVKNIPSCVVSGCSVDPANAYRCAIFDSL